MRQRQYYPKFQVIHWPVMTDNSPADITDLLGDGCTIHTSKSIFEPAGQFTISFLDAPIRNDQERGGDMSLYARFYAMDAIEIKAAHDGSRDPVTIMRGFVSSVRRDETMGADGRPTRRVMISGLDVGKMLLTIGVGYLPIPEDELKLLARMAPLTVFTGGDTKALPATTVLENACATITDQLNAVLADSDLKLSVVAAAEGKGDVAGGKFQNISYTPLYQFFSHLLDAGTLYEFWMDDPGEGPAFLRWRELYSGGNGVVITEDEIEAISTWRDDSRVSNWFWYWPNSGMFYSNALGHVEASKVSQNSQSALTYHWSAKKYFGFRKLEVESSLLPPGWAPNSDSPPAPAVKAGQPLLTEWIEKQTHRLKELNQDNSRIEKCSVRMLGAEDVRPGLWHTVRKSEAEFRYYCTQVDHEISFFGGFTTTVHGDRGYQVSGDGTYREELNLSGAQE